MPIRCGRAGADDGMVTAELAACLPVLAIAVLAGFAALSVADQQVRAQDAAAEVARAEARGDPSAASRLFGQTAPAGSTFTVATADGQITATVRLAVRPFGGVIGSYTVSERAVAAIEPKSPS
jgi:hypothetical protein